MFEEYLLLFIVFAILLLGRILSDRRDERQQWFCYYEQRKITAPIPQKIVTHTDIPQPYQAEFSAHRALPYILYIPGCSAILRRRADRLFALYEKKLVIYEEHADSRQEISFDDILYLEHGKMLFSFWLTIVCPQQSYTIEYHSKGDDAFSPIITSIRSQSCQNEREGLTAENGRQIASLANFHYKFMTMAKRSLLPGQKILNLLFQPSYTRTKKLYGTMLSVRRVYTPHLCMMTQDELISIRERDEIQRSCSEQYTGRTFWIPFRMIGRVEMLEEKSSGLFQLQLHLHGDISLPISFAKEHEQLRSFVNTLHAALLPPKNLPT